MVIVGNLVQDVAFGKRQPNGRSAREIFARPKYVVGGCMLSSNS